MNPDLLESIESLELQYTRDLESLDKRLSSAEGDVKEHKEAILIIEKKLTQLKKDKEKLG